VDLAIVHPHPVAGKALRGSAATFLNNKEEQKGRESANPCGRMGVYFPPWCSTPGEACTGTGMTW